MTISVTNNGQNNGYSSLINYLRVNNVYSREIDGIVDKRVNRKIDPDEWERFFKQAEQYYSTTCKIAEIKPPKKDKPLEELISFYFSLVGSSNKRTAEYGLWVLDKIVKDKNIKPAIKENIGIKIVDLIKARQIIAGIFVAQLILNDIINNHYINNHAKTYIISQLLTLKKSDKITDGFVDEAISQLFLFAAESKSVDPKLKEYIYNELSPLENGKRYKNHVFYIRQSLDATAKDPKVNSKIKEDRLRKYISCLRSGKSDPSITDITWAVNEIAKDPINNVYITAKNVLNLLQEKDSFSSKEIETIELVNDKEKDGVAFHIRYNNGLDAYFYALTNANAQNRSLISVIRLLPAEFFKGLKNISFRKECYETAPGKCDDLNRQIIMHGNIESADVLIHEIFHYWDLTIASRNGSIISKRFKPFYDDPDDPGKIFQNISWNKPSFILRFFKGRYGLMIAKDKDENDFLCIRSVYSPAFKYGQSNCLEDLATFSLFVTDPANLREYVREQMEKGNFEPAAKYLFVRFIMPFNDREYEVSGVSPSLGFKEVKTKLNTWLKGHPNSVRQTTIDAINIIEERSKILIK